MHESLKQQLFTKLNEIIDPCSIATALPAGLGDMGLIRSLEIETTDAGALRCRVELCVTHAFCMMSAVFVNEVEKRLRQVPELAEIDVTLDCRTVWTEDLMSPTYRERLEDQRRRKMLS